MFSSHPHVAGGRSREGAWIEIFQIQAGAVTADVAPARERGLKFTNIVHALIGYTAGRSREGAWIEMCRIW